MINLKGTTSNNKHFYYSNIPTTEDAPIIQFGAAAIKKKPKELNPDTQQAILEVATVRRIQNEIDYANAFSMRYQRMSLQLEDAV